MRSSGTNRTSLLQRHRTLYDWPVNSNFHFSIINRMWLVLNLTFEATIIITVIEKVTLFKSICVLMMAGRANDL